MSKGVRDDRKLKAVCLLSVNLVVCVVYLNGNDIGHRIISRIIMVFNRKLHSISYKKIEMDNNL